MNSKILSAALLVACLGLGAGWFLTTRKAAEDKASATAAIAGLTNELVTASFKLQEQQKVNATLNTDLSEREKELNNFSNKWTFVSTTLATTEAEAKAAADAARAEIEKRDKHIHSLEGEKDALSQKMDGLTQEIGGLNSKIADTERKLASSEGDRQQLQKELKRLLAEKAELERKFADLAVLREQVSKLKEELSIARRIDFIRRGLYGFDKKGAQLVNSGIRGAAKTNAPESGPQLKVEVGTDGSSKIEAAPEKK
jgi:chromosome segregation ATPase